MPGTLFGVQFGMDDRIKGLLANGMNTYAMATLNRGFCFRFLAASALDIYTVYLKWSSVSAPGSIEVRIETVDATTGKPTGSLYDANATVTITPTSGWQACTFASPPSTGLTPGTEYAIVVLTTVAGTTQTLNAYTGGVGTYPTICLSATDGTTRSNFAELSASAGLVTALLSDGSSALLGHLPFDFGTLRNIYTTNAVALKFVVPANVTLTAARAEIYRFVRTGTPAGDLRVRIFNSSDTAVTNSTVTVDKESLTNANNQSVRITFAGLVTLAAGTYRLVFDSASSADTSNCWGFRDGAYRASGEAPSGLCLSTTTDITAGTISWSDTATSIPCVGLGLDGMSGAGGGDGGFFF